MSGKFWSRAWSLVDGCTPVSAGCDNCWLAAIEKRFRGIPDIGERSLVDLKGNYTGVVRFRTDRLDIPIRTRKPTVFAIWSDLYHEAVTPFQIGQSFGVMQECEQHTFLIVTKRPERAAGNIIALPNVYHLVTVENQEMADERIPYALKIPGKVGLLIEPMLGPVDLRGCYAQKLGKCDPDGVEDFCNGCFHSHPLKNISCIILGGETGPKARPMNPDWARSVRDQCHMSGVPFFLKFIDKKHGRVLDEQEHNELPWEVK